MILTPENILAKTENGLHIYLYILKEHFPKKNFRKLLKQHRPVPNPFISGGQLLIGNSGQGYEHSDLHLPGFAGTALDFAAHHYKAATLPELYYLLNQNLRLGLKIPSEELYDTLKKSDDREDLPKLSYFEPPISNTQPAGALSLPQLYRRITGPYYQKTTETLRKIKDPKEARQYKANNFPYVTFGGRFEKRSDNHLLQASGLMVIDLDHLEDVATVREALIADTTYETELLFVSPSGHGLKWITGYSPQHSHLEYFTILSNYLEAVFNLTPDPSGKDISRACFLCHDPDAFLHRKYLFGRKTEDHFSGEWKVESGKMSGQRAEGRGQNF